MNEKGYWTTLIDVWWRSIHKLQTWALHKWQAHKECVQEFVTLCARNIGRPRIAKIALLEWSPWIKRKSARSFLFQTSNSPHANFISFRLYRTMIMTKETTFFLKNPTVRPVSRLQLGRFRVAHNNRNLLEKITRQMDFLLGRASPTIHCWTALRWHAIGAIFPPRPHYQFLRTNMLSAKGDRVDQVGCHVYRQLKPNR